MSTDEKLDQVSNTIAFLLARVKGDADMAMAIVGGDSKKIATLLMGMTDLAMGMVILMAELTGCTPKVFVETMAMGAKFYGPEFMSGDK